MDSFTLAPKSLQAIRRCASEMMPLSIFSEESMITLETLQVRINSAILVTSGKIRITFLICGTGSPKLFNNPLCQNYIYQRTGKTFSLPGNGMLTPSFNFPRSSKLTQENIQAVEVHMIHYHYLIPVWFFVVIRYKSISVCQCSWNK